VSTQRPLAFEAVYRVRFDEAGPNGLLRTSGFMRFAQDVAWQHSTALGFGREWYAERGLTWLVRSAELRIEAGVPLGAELTVRTEVVAMRRVFARRRGEFRLGDGRRAGWVHTDWVMIDGRGALTRIPPIFGEIFGGLDATGQIGRVALPATPADAELDPVVVRRHELDPMAHANNAVYLDWLEEAIEGGGRAGRAVDALPRGYRMEYVAAVAEGDRLERAAWLAGDSWHLRLTLEDTGQEAFRALVRGGGSPD
jgi:acyl-CoA thioester hydrolase